MRVGVGAVIDDRLGERVRHVDIHGPGGDRVFVRQVVHGLVAGEVVRVVDLVGGGDGESEGAEARAVAGDDGWVGVRGEVGRGVLGEEGGGEGGVEVWGDDGEGEPGGGVPEGARVGACAVGEPEGLGGGGEGRGEEVVAPVGAEGEVCV